MAKDHKSRLGGARGAEDVKAHPFYSEMSWKHLEAGLVPPLFVPDVSRGGVVASTCAFRHTQTRTQTHTHTHKWQYSTVTYGASFGKTSARNDCEVLQV